MSRTFSIDIGRVVQLQRTSFALTAYSKTLVERGKFTGRDVAELARAAEIAAAAAIADPTQESRAKRVAAKLELARRNHELIAAERQSMGVIAGEMANVRGAVEQMMEAV